MVSCNVSLPDLVSPNLSKLSQATLVAALAFQVIPNGVTFTAFVASIAISFSIPLIV